MLSRTATQRNYRWLVAGAMACLVGSSLQRLATAALGADGPLSPVPAAHQEVPTPAMVLEPGVQVARDGAFLVIRRGRPDASTSRRRPELTTYVLRRGETLRSVARAHGTDIGTLLALNGVSDEAQLMPGQELQVPSRFSGVVHVVQAGDTLERVSIMHEISLDDVESVNQLTRDEPLPVGALLWLPGATPRNLVASRGEGPRREPAPEVSLVTAPAAPPKPAPKVAPVTAPPQPKRAVEKTPTGWIWPIRHGLAFSEFGPREGRLHTGLDIAAPYGTEVVAAKGGTVTFAGWDGGYGYCVIIDIGKGIRTRYAHAAKILVKVGQAVKQGAAVIQVGSTGNSTGPHLHFEVQVDGTLVNPRKYLPGGD